MFLSIFLTATRSPLLLSVATYVYPNWPWPNNFPIVYLISKSLSYPKSVLFPQGITPRWCLELDLSFLYKGWFLLLLLCVCCLLLQFTIVLWLNLVVLLVFDVEDVVVVVVVFGPVFFLVEKQQPISFQVIWGAPFLVI